jgi:DNA polymerase I
VIKIGLFDLPKGRTTKEADKKLTKKAKQAKESVITIKGGNSLLERINTISAMVNKHLGKYADAYQVIREEKELDEYITKAIKNGYISIDTETNSLDPITCTLAGVCMFTAGEKSTYIPLHHVSYVTGLEVDNQISEEFMAKQLKRLGNTKIRMFNAKFDIRVIKNQLGVTLNCYWDAFIAARLLNENEDENNLKYLHNKYCLNGKNDAFTFNDLFKGIPFTHIPIKTGYIYAARDAEITNELCIYQEPFLTPENPICKEKDLLGVSNVFWDIEMPLIDVIVDIEDVGVDFDIEYSKELSKKYEILQQEKEQNFYKICDMYKDEIEDYKLKAGTTSKLNVVINIGSSTQIAILIYDILKLSHNLKKEPIRGTGEAILQSIDHEICKAILEYRGIAKLLSTYINKMSNEINAKTGRIHCSFNQLGTVTGRFSSNSPNMQNIPSHNKDIRKMFKATDGYVLIGGDYSAQEVRLAAHASQDENMIQAYLDGKDLYAEIASIAFNQPYDECKEFRPDGTKNEDGAKRRYDSKQIVLATMYGKGIQAISNDLKCSKHEAQNIYDKIMNALPKLKEFMEDSKCMAIEHGYVTTIWGRKRRLPNMQLQPYEFTYGEKKANVNFDPMEFDSSIEEFTNEVDEETQQKYIKALNKCRGYKDKEQIKARASQQGIKIKDNGGYIADAERQTVNSRIQGSAGDLLKKAMILVHHNKKLKELGFRLVLTVHDELIGECPLKEAKEASQLFCSLMSKAAEGLSIPFPVDAEITYCWYGEGVEL